MSRAVSTLCGCVAILICAMTAAQSTPKLVPGVTLRAYQLEGDYQRLPDLRPAQTANFDQLRPVVDFARGSFFEVPSPFYSTVTGFLEIHTNGEYQFRLTSDDGSRLKIGKLLACDHDGRHGATSRLSEIMQLSVGRYPLRIDHFDSGGNRVLKLEWRRPGQDQFSITPSSALLTESDPTRLTSPGLKQVRGARRSGDRAPLTGVHPSYRVETIRPEGFEPRVGALAFLKDGRLVVGTFDPLQRDSISLPDIDAKEPDKLYAIDGFAHGTPLAVEVIAEGLHEPAGLCAVRNTLYVSQRKAITRLTDRDGDGFFETHLDVGSGWEGWNYHQFTFSVLHRHDKLYAALSTAMAPPGWEGMGTNAAVIGSASPRQALRCAVHSHGAPWLGRDGNQRSGERSAPRFDH